MRVVSFDVGIKHLAYCVVEWNESDDMKNNLKIHSWGIINLVESQNKDDAPLCHCFDEKCSSKVKSYIEVSTNKYYFCNKHFTKREILLKDTIDPFLENKWEQLYDVKCCKCNIPDGEQKKSKKSYYMNKTINMTLCNTHYKQFINNINKSTKKVHSIKKKNVNDLTTYDLKLQLIKCFDERKEIFLKGIDMVLIENQPAFKNPKMKAISDTLYTWFMVRGIVDKDINNASIGDIKFISPSNKLREFDQKLILDADESKKYKVTKKLSIENTKSMLMSYGLNEWVKYMMSYDKQDDLADSFLQGWYVLNNNHDDKLFKEWEILYDKTAIDVDGVEYEIKKTDGIIENELPKVGKKKGKTNKIIKDVNIDNIIVKQEQDELPKVGKKKH